MQVGGANEKMLIRAQQPRRKLISCRFVLLTRRVTEGRAGVRARGLAPSV